MRFLIVGAGAIGGFVAARLAQAGHPVTVLARGAHLAAIRARGLRVETHDGRVEAPTPVAAIDDMRAAPRADVVIVTLKAYQVPALAGALGDAARDARILLPIQNGVGWWYFQRHGGTHDGRVVRAVDPDGELAVRLPSGNTIPAFAYKSAEVVTPGVVRHLDDASDRFTMGELDGDDTPRLSELAAIFEGAGMATTIGDVRQAMWNKLLGNIFANPICALTRRTLGDVVYNPATRALALELMRETSAVAASLGRPVSIAPEARLRRAEAMAAAKPSMLQDLEAGRPLELDAILAALVELADLGGVATPRIATLLACLRLVDPQRAASHAIPHPEAGAQRQTGGRAAALST